MKAMVIRKPGEIGFEEVPVPSVQSDEVLIRTRFCGLCGTDLHILHGKFIAEYPVIPGHEFAGEIADFGDKVKDIEIGQEVCVYPAVYCGECYYCRKGQANHCEKKKAYGVRMDGGLAEYVKVKKSNVFPLQRVTMEEGAMIEPLACVIYGLKRALINPGASVLILGCGTIGLMHLQMSKALGASNIACTDINPVKLDKAKELGASAVFRADEIEGKINEYQPMGFDLIIDATGIAGVIQSMPDYAAKCGTLLYFGVAGKEERVTISPYEVYKKDLKILGSCTLLPADFQQALMLAGENRINLKTLISNRADFSDAIKALKGMEKGEGLYKTVIDIQSGLNKP